MAILLQRKTGFAALKKHTKRRFRHAETVYMCFYPWDTNNRAFDPAGRPGRPFEKSQKQSKHVCRAI